MNGNRINRKMKKRELEASLRRAVQEQAPEVLPAVLAAVEDQRRIRVMENPAVQKNKRRPVLWAAVAAAAALVLVTGGIFGYSYMNKAETVATIDVNPSVELRVNRRERVTAVTALNEDAKTILDDMDLKNTHLNVAVNALIGAMVREGYISDIKNSVLVSVEDSDTSRGQRLQEQITADIAQALEQSAVEAAVLSQTLAEDQSLKETAHQFGISMGKANLIREILAKDPTLKAESLAGLSITDLSLILLSKEPEANQIVSSGQVSDKNYIGTERAKEIALGKVPGGRVTKVEYDMEDGRIVYEVDILLGGVEHEFEIDALTGDILKWEQEREDDDDHNRPDSSDKPTTPTSPQASVIGLDRAKEIAEGRLPGGTVTKLELDKEDGRWIYEGEIRKDNVEVDFEIDAYSGEIIQWEQDIDDDHPNTTLSGKVIGMDKAKQIAETRLPGGKVVELELDEDDGRLIYEGEIETTAVEAEFEIDAITGEVIKWKTEKND